ncbi:MAG: esterase [Burkholderiaceae bacterium]|nr:esterase [Burkholderiaceae bacterium]
MVLYLHGFRSSPLSFKAQMMANAMAARGKQAAWRCPQLPPSPAAAMTIAGEQLQALIHAVPGRDPAAVTIVGSSLGGYYATWLAEQFGTRAVLINPAVHAPRDLATQVGTQRDFHTGVPFEFLPAYIGELERMRVSRPTKPGRYLLIAATGDEVLDWREMRDYFADCAQIIVPGSDHGLSDFEQWLPRVMAFAGHA